MIRAEPISLDEMTFAALEMNMERVDSVLA
jgi:hypothetical protein